MRLNVFFGILRHLSLSLSSNGQWVHAGLNTLYLLLGTSCAKTKRKHKTEKEEKPQIIHEFKSVPLPHCYKPIFNTSLKYWKSFILQTTASGSLPIFQRRRILRREVLQWTLGKTHRDNIHLLSFIQHCGELCSIGFLCQYGWWALSTSWRHKLCPAPINEPEDIILSSTALAL